MKYWLKRVLEILINFKTSPTYKIKRGYIHRKTVPHFDDMKNEDQWQKEVYLKTKDFMHENKLNSICDFGCGSGFKLLNYFDEFEKTGVEIEPTISKLKVKYPKNKWVSKEEIVGQKFDVVILADVIEHVPFPDKFILDLVNNFDFKYIVISTPDRSIRGSRFGPPINIHHYREWTKEELNSFLSLFFVVLSHEITNVSQTTQMAICKKSKC